MLEELEESDSNRVLIGAIQKNSDDATIVEKIRSTLNNINKDTNVGTLNGSNLFLRADTFKFVGGFPPQLKTCEDVYFSGKVSKLGTLFYTSRTSYIHLGEDKEYMGMFRKEIWRGQSNLQSLTGRKIPFREIPSIVIPLILMILLILSIILIIQNYLVLSFVSIITLIIPVTIYAIRLHKHTISQNIKFSDLFLFYLIYFSARSAGTYIGLFKFLR